MNKKKPDIILLIIIILLLFWGLFTLATVSFPYSLEKYGGSWHYFKHQLLVGLLPGIIAALFFFKIELAKLKKLSIYLLGLNLFLLILIFLPHIGAEINGARRWLKLGPIMFQPSEFLKITFPLYISAWLSNKLKRGGKKKSNIEAPFVFIIMAVILGIIFLLQPDLSTFVIIVLIGAIIYFVSSTPWWHFLILIFGGAGLLSLFIKLSPYRMNRVITMFNPQSDPLGAGYQLKQALIAIGSGRIFGINEGFSLGLSRQKFGFLPHSMTDSIFAIVGEELGFVGAFLLVFLFLALAWKGIQIAKRSKSEFAKLLAVGIVSWFSFQAFFNICGITGILPLAGIPLPFFSYGASHLIAEMAGLGILLNLSKI